jgi:hypothetical protein
MAMTVDIDPEAGMPINVPLPLDIVKVEPLRPLDDERIPRLPLLHLGKRMPDQLFVKLLPRLGGARGDERNLALHRETEKRKREGNLRRSSILSLLSTLALSSARLKVAIVLS